MRLSFGIYFARDFVKLIFYHLIILSPGVLFARQDSIRSDNGPCTLPVISEFKIFNEDLPLDSVLRLKEIELSPQKNSFTISFAAANTANNVYYMLDGADKNWTRAHRSATINYTLLPPGRYDFKFKCNDQGKTALVIIIGVPFYLSSWFIILGCAAFVGIAYFLHTLSVKRLMAVEAVRQRVSRDLHDDIGSTLSTINILSMMAKSKMIEDPVKASEYIGKIGDNSSRLMEAMDDIVWSINPMNDTMQKIFARMREFATEVFEAKEVDTHFHFDERAYDLSLNMEQRRDFFLIFKEAVNNVAKYANATEVNVDVILKDHTLSLIVKDNGRGFDVENADTGNGLNNMHKRAEKLNAKFDISSQQNTGTTISLNMHVA
jgi:anti-sigma regulatory factor (Ser/Thr protein kinase)